MAAWGHSLPSAVACDERLLRVKKRPPTALCVRAALFGMSEGGPMSILFAATYPERTRALCSLLYGAFAHSPMWSSVPPEQFEARLSMLGRR
jgi:pimeloyl-ACP methyl ester carboxylesterase